MRVCFFVPKCTPDNSHGRYVIELASRLGRQQNVTVYTGAVASQLRAIVQCHYLPVPQRPAVARIVALWASSVALVTHGRFDIVHTQGADAPVGDVITAQFCNSAMKASVGEQPSIVRRINYAIGSGTAWRSPRRARLLPSLMVSNATSSVITAWTRKNW